MTDWEQRAKAAESELTALVYAISHDLQEPVRKVSSFSQLLVRSLDDPTDQQKRWADYVQDGTERLRQMIEALLQISRIGRRESPPKMQDTQAIIRLAWSTLNPPAEATLNVESAPNVVAAPQEFGHLWQNLLQNALVFSNGSPAITVRATGTDEIQFEVADTGIGIPQESRERVFDLFGRLHARDAGYPGVGAGLTYCRAIVQSVGGKMWIEDNQPAGTRVFFTWPTIENYDGGD